MPDGSPNCPSCGARVEAKPGEQGYVYTCRFCGAHIPIAPIVKPRDPQADLARAAAEIRAERARAAEAVAPAKRRAKGLGCLFGLVMLLPVLVPLGIAFGPQVMSLYSSTYGTFPIAVGMNDSLEIADRDATSDDTLITVGVNGKLTLRRCHLKSAQVIRAGVNAEITIIDSTLEGTRGVIEGAVNVVVTVENSTLISAEEILDGPSNVKITVRKGSKLQSQAIALPMENSGTVTVDHSEVDGKIGAIELKNNGTVKLVDGAVVKSDAVAIDLLENGHLSIASSRVEGKTIAVHAVGNLEGTLHGATLVGPHAALDVGTNAHLTVAQSNLQGARKLGANSSIDDR